MNDDDCCGQMDDTVNECGHAVLYESICERVRQAFEMLWLSVVSLLSQTSPGFVV